jgi:L-2-hydroxyglutarate oxidase LhgO
MLRNTRLVETAVSFIPVFYYKPGSLKATFAREGNRSMVEFCRGHAQA